MEVRPITMNPAFREIPAELTENVAGFNSYRIPGRVSVNISFAAGGKPLDLSDLKSRIKAFNRIQSGESVNVGDRVLHKKFGKVLSLQKWKKAGIIGWILCLTSME